MSLIRCPRFYFAADRHQDIVLDGKRILILRTGCQRAAGQGRFISYILVGNVDGNIRRGPFGINDAVPGIVVGIRTIKRYDLLYASPCQQSRRLHLNTKIARKGRATLCRFKYQRQFRIYMFECEINGFAACR